MNDKRIVTVRYTDGYVYDTPVLLTVPKNLSDKDVETCIQEAVGEYRRQLGYEDADKAEDDGYVFGSLLPEVTLGVFRKYGIGFLHADVLTADYDKGF